MSLTEDIAETIEAAFDAGGPAIYDHAAAAVLDLLRELSDASVWYCTRVGSADYNPVLCERYGHKGCGRRFVVDLGEPA